MSAIFVQLCPIICMDSVDEHHDHRRNRLCCGKKLGRDYSPGRIYIEFSWHIFGVVDHCRTDLDFLHVAGHVLDVLVPIRRNDLL